METCKEIDVPDEMLIWEDLLNFDCTNNLNEKLQDRYNTLHETYIKEIENSKKVKKSLEKCLKIYSKLCKKFEAQQKIIQNLQKTIEEKMNCLEESNKNQEKMKGLIDIYKSERILYCDESNFELKRDKEMLLDICCQLISESVKTNNIKNITNLFLRKFKKDLSHEKLNLLKSKQMNSKGDSVKIKGQISKSLHDEKYSLSNSINNSNELSSEDKELNEGTEEHLKSHCKTNNAIMETNFRPILNHSELSNQKSLKLDVESLDMPTADCSVEVYSGQEIHSQNEKNSDCAKENESNILCNIEEEKGNKEDSSINKELSLRTDNILISLPILENDAQEISDFSEAENGQSAEFASASSENRTTLSNVKNNSNKKNYIKLTNNSSVTCEYSNSSKFCLTEKQIDTNELGIASSTVICQDNSEQKKLISRNQKVSECNKKVIIKKSKSKDTANNASDQQKSEESNVKKNGKLLKNEILQTRQGCEANFASDNSPSESNNSDNSCDNPGDMPLILEDSHSLENENSVERSNKLNCTSIQDNFNENKKLDISEPAAAAGITEPQELLSFRQSIFEIPAERLKMCIDHSKNEKSNCSRVPIDSGENLLDGEKNISHAVCDDEFILATNKETRKTENQILPPSPRSYSKNNTKDLLTMDDSSKDSINDSYELEFSFENNTNVGMFEQEQDEEELSSIFSQMTTVRLLSPIREIGKRDFETGFVSKNDGHHLPSKSHESAMPNGLPCPDSEKKRDNSPSFTSKSKKIKVEETVKTKMEKKNGGDDFLDSIISAMSIQNKEFKSNVFNKINFSTDESEKLMKNCENKIHSDNSKSPAKENEREEEEEKKEEEETKNVDRFQMGKKNYDNRSSASENLLKESIQKFVSSLNSSKEEADKNVKECISVLTNNSDEMIARVIVCIVFENVNEEVEAHDRPVPPLTNTQYRIIILLSVLKSQDPRRENINSIIMEKISQKLFPDKFLWPDDAIETASRFYVALCKNRNDIQTCWKFCLQAMTEMKQRSFLVVFVALKTWPDILHNATDLKNNLLALTVVNIFLHMPKPMRKSNQKLIGLKRILMGFYGFKVDETIENYSVKILDSFFKDESAAEKSLVLLAKCRDLKWTRKYVFTKLFAALKEEFWETENGESSGRRILSVLKQTVPIWFNSKENSAAEKREMISCLSEILISKKATHDSEEKIIELLLDMKRHPEVRKIIREWIPRNPIDDSLRNRIVNVSAENILRELKFNRKKGESEKGVLRKRKIKFKGKICKKKIKKN